MKKVILVLLMLATPVFADLSVPVDRLDYPVYTAVAATEGGLRGTGTGPICYSSIAGPYAGFGASTSWGWDDYVTNSATQISAVKFAGGVTAVSANVYFDFYSYTGWTASSSPVGTAWVTGFGVHLSQAGNFLWTISFGSGVITIPHTGILQITSTGGSGRWYLTQTLPSVGSNNPLHGGYPPSYFHAFEFRTPEPTTLTLLGAGALLLFRRR